MGQKVNANSLRLNITDTPQQRKPLFVDCNDNYLVLFTTDSFFYQYLIVCQYDKYNTGT